MAVRQVEPEYQKTAVMQPVKPDTDESNLPIEDREFLVKRRQDAMELARLIYDIFKEEKASNNGGDYVTIEEHTT